MDVAILGAGPVGATAAALACGCGLEVGVFEARSAPSGERRVLALSQASREILEEARAWPQEAATPITTIHVSQKGGPGRVVLDAREQGLEALGYTLRLADLETALARRLREAGAAPHYGETCEDIVLERDAARMRFASGREVRTRLLVLADGGANAAKIPGIAYETRDYGQHALTAMVATDRPHGERAYERFTPRGPAALLPSGERFALVWTESPREAARLLALGEAEFLAQLQEHFGDRAGRFTALEGRASFPLALRVVNTPIALRTAIVGSAAQALHPIAGQGLNLGLRDAAGLAAAVNAVARENIGGDAMLAAHREARARDSARGVAFTDFLVSAFAGGSRLPAWGRGLALTLFDLIPAARRALADRMIHGPYAG